MSKESEKCPLQVKELDSEETAEMSKYFTENILDGFIRIGPKGYWFTRGITEVAPKIYNMALRPDDTWIVTFMKSGTTLMQELVWLLSNDCDFAKAESIPQVERFPFLEASMYFNNKQLQSIYKVDGKVDSTMEKLAKSYEASMYFNNTQLQSIYKVDSTMEKLAKSYEASMYFNNKQLQSIYKVDGKVDSTMEKLAKSYEYVSELQSPRFIKSHLPLSMLPPTLLDTCKIVYVARDPRDVIVSYYHHTRLYKILGYTGDLKQYWNLFIQNKLDYTPYFDCVKEVWEMRNHPNLLFLFYEEILKDLPSTVKKVAKFLGKTVTDQQLVRLCDYLSIESFKNNKSVNMDVVRQQLHSGDKNVSPFIREGKTGGWRKNFDEEMTRQAEQWMADNLRDTDLRYPNP